MTNPYYNFDAPDYFVPGNKVRATPVNNQFAGVAEGFDLLPADPDALTNGTATFAIESGTGNAYVVTMPNTRATNGEGDEVVFKATHTNTGPATLQVDAIGAVPFRRYDGTPLQSGDVVLGQYYAVVFDNANTQFLVTYPTLQTNVGVLTYASPTAQVGLAAIGGAAVTVMRSDAAPALNVGISPTWTGTHTFNVPIALTSGGTGVTTAALAMNLFGATRTVTAGAGLTGGGTLGADRTFDVGQGTGITVNANDVALSAGTLTSLGLADTSVQPARTLTAGAGLTGGGDLSANRTFDVGQGTGITVNANDVALSAGTLTSLGLADTSVQPARTLTAGAGLTGGGDLSANRAFDVGQGTGITVNANDVALDTASTRNTDHAGVSISGGTSLTGGGAITTNQTITLVNDSGSPGNNTYYGTNGAGTKGFFAIPAAALFKFALAKVSSGGVLTETINTDSASRSSAGVYTIDYTSAGFTGVPYVNATTTFGASGSAAWISSFMATATQCSFQVADFNGAAFDAAFHVSVLGT